MKSLLVVIVAGLSLTVQGKVVEHKVQENETAWFVSQVYYGQGAKFSEILKFNHLKSADEVKPGLSLRIEDPKFDPENKSFQVRMAFLRKKRLEQLGLHSNASEPTKKVAPKKAANSNLPFSEVRDSQKSPQEKARDELNIRASSSDVD